MLLLAAAMPLCCCVMSRMAATPVTDGTPTAMSCCGASASCKSGEQSPAQDEPPGCNGCRCIKAAGTIDDWSPPADLIGTPIDVTDCVLTCIAATETPTRPFVGGPLTGPPGPWSASGPPLRHATILQV